MARLGLLDMDLRFGVQVSYRACWRQLYCTARARREQAVGKLAPNANKAPPA